MKSLQTKLPVTVTFRNNPPFNIVTALPLALILNASDGLSTRAEERWWIETQLNMWPNRNFFKWWRRTRKRLTPSKSFDHFLGVLKVKELFHVAALVETNVQRSVYLHKHERHDVNHVVPSILQNKPVWIWLEVMSKPRCAECMDSLPTWKVKRGPKE